MSRVELAAELVDDFDRILTHLVEHKVENLASRIQDIIAAFDVLERNPLIGRSATGDKRELVIGRGSVGYVALYRYLPDIDAVLVLAVRSQHEAGYSRS